MSAHDESQCPRGLPPIGGGFADVLENFHVMKYDGELTGTKLVLLEPDDPMFSLLAAVVHLSLRILEHEPALAALQKVGVGICESWVERGDFTKEDATPIIRDMERLVHYYVRKLRSSFCNLVVAKIDGSFALAKRRQPRWGATDYKYTSPDDFDPDAYDPKDMGVIVFTGNEDDPMIMELLRAQKAAKQELIEQGDEEAQNALCQFHKQLLWFSMVMSHECAHVFTVFLSSLHGARFWSNTPEEVYANASLQAYPCKTSQLGTRTKRRAKGEAGYAFEYFAWGGVSEVLMLEDTNTDDFYAFNGLRLHIQTNVNGAVMDRIIPDKVIKRFMDAPADFNLEDLLGPDTILAAVQGHFDDDVTGNSNVEEPEPHGGIDPDNCAYLVTALQMENYGNMPKFDVNTEDIERFVKDPAGKVVPGKRVGDE